MLLRFFTLFAGFLAVSALCAVFAYGLYRACAYVSDRYGNVAVYVLLVVIWCFMMAVSLTIAAQT